VSATRWLTALKILFFLSGSTGLVFEVLWTRQLSNLVGATSVAMTCVFSVFIVCLSLGALIASRLRIYDRRALYAYGILEILIGLFGWGVTLLMLHGDVQLVRYIPLTAGTGDVLVQMLATFVLIGIPTTAMGATLPLVMNAVRQKALPSSQVAGLYGANVIGGATGALACGFVLLWQLGVTGTAVLALVIDVVLGLVAFGLARMLKETHETADEAPSPAPAKPPAGRRAHPLLYPGLAFLTGLFTLCFELLWGRMAKLYMGDRTMATSTLLFIYLSCMALGSFAVGVLYRRRKTTSLSEGLGRFGTMLAVAAPIHLVGVALIHWIIATPTFAPSIQNAVLPRIAFSYVAMLIPVTVLGMAFPFLMQTAGRIDERPGLAVGTLYFINSVGAALGALLGGFLAPRTVGTLVGFLLTALATVVVALLCFAAGPGSQARRLVRSGVAIGALILAALTMPRDLRIYDEGQTLIDHKEDEYGIQLLTQKENGDLHVKSNRLYVAYTLGPLVTNFTQETISYASCLLSESCDDVLNIGTGYGITAGAFTVLDEPRQVTTIEILPFVCDHQSTFGPWNFNYLEDPRATLLCTEGRRWLAASDTTFDIISVNVLDPYVPGSSSLFTTDFWEMAKQKLSPGGVYSQLIWGPDANRLLAGMRTVFPTVLQFPGGWKDTFNVIAFAEPTDPRLRLERITPRMQEAMAKFRAAFPAMPERAEDFFTQNLQTALRLDELARRDPPQLLLHTDDMPILEFRLARGDGLTETYEQYKKTSAFDSVTVKP
jgi:predicted membrane-bound spermidine synthase